MRKKTFDCIEMKRKGAERVMKRTEGMTLEEELKYWQEGTANLRERQKQLASKIK
ncbi:MAG: hypothetical protein ACYSO7_00455 [Planctomycetota bacterium]|jgi:exonuclease VII small subunit